MKISGKRNGASPAGPVQSAAKRLRLAALDNALSGTILQTTAAAVCSKESAMLSPNHLPQPFTTGTANVEGGSGKFPYNRLGGAVLDGSLSNALASAKAAAVAAASVTASITSGACSAIASRASPMTHTAAAAEAAAVSTAARSELGAADIFAQLVHTSSRGSCSEFRDLLAQRLQDRSIMLDNPTAPVKVNQLFARRATNYSAKLRSGSQRKHTLMSKGSNSINRATSYEAMLRVHELWLRYTNNLSQPSTASGGVMSGTSSPSLHILSRVADLHGAMLSVVRHVNTPLVGVTGIVLRRNGKNIHLVTPGDRVRVVPLKGCIAQYTVNGTTIQLSG